MGKKVKIPFGGGIIDGEVMPVNVSHEEWCEHVLADGTIIRIKAVVLRVIKVPGKLDPMGNQAFVIQSNNVVVVESPEQLGEPETGGKNG